MKYITIALAKGRLAKQTLALLEQTGITCEEMKDKDTRKLIFINEELKLKFFLSKTSDVPTYVEYGAADLGVVGSDTIMEEGRKVLEVLDLGLGKCNMCVAGPASAKELLHNNQVIRVASKYPAIAKNYFYNQKHHRKALFRTSSSHGVSASRISSSWLRCSLMVGILSIRSRKPLGFSFIFLSR